MLITAQGKGGESCGGSGKGERIAGGCEGRV